MLTRTTHPAVRERLAAVPDADWAVASPLVDLRVLHSARTAAEYELWPSDRGAGYRSMPLTPEIGEQTLEV